MWLYQVSKLVHGKEIYDVISEHFDQKLASDEKKRLQEANPEEFYITLMKWSDEL